MLRRLLPAVLLLVACDESRPPAAPAEESCAPACAPGTSCIDGRCEPVDEPRSPAAWQAPTGPAGLGVLSAMLVTSDLTYLAGYGTMAVASADGATLRDVEAFPEGRVEELIEAGDAVFARNIEGLVAVTRDGGATWQAPAIQLAVSTLHADGETIFVTGFDAEMQSAFYRSSNAGSAWEKIEEVFPTHLAVGEGWLFARDALSHTFVLSEDGGASWTELPDPPFVTAGFDVVLQAWEGALVALTDRPLQAFVSFDHGATWSTELLDADSNGASQRWLVGSRDGLFAVTNGGSVHRLATPDATWSAAGEGLPAGAFVEAVSGGPRGAWIAWRGELYRFDVEAAAWLPGETQVVRTFVGDVAVDGDTVWAVVDGKLVHRSDDGGSTWTQVASPGSDVHAIRAIAAADGKVWVGTWGHGILRSDDRGATWVALAGVPSMIGEPGVQPWGVEDLLYENGTLYAATWAMVHMGGTDGNFQYAGIGVIRSSDGGETWSVGDAGLPSIGSTTVHGVLRSGANRILAAGGALFLSTYGSGIFRSDDGGASWQEAGRGMPGGVLDATAELLDLVEQGDVLYAAVGVNADQGSGLRESHDGGLTWRATAAAPPGACSARALALVEGRLVVSWDRVGGAEPNEGIWASGDGARTWERAGEGLPALPVDNLTVGGGALLAGTEGNGIWRLPLAAP